MIFGFLVLICALFIAGIAAWFSIAGLMAIFASAAIPIAIMGAALEAGKLLAASWLYRHWGSAPLFLKTYLIAAVVALMVITSMGIFGYLSKAHLDQTAGLGTNNVQIERLDTQIGRAEREIERSESALDQLDAAIDEYTERGFVTRGLEARDEQRTERERLSENISIAEQRINEYQDQRSELQTQIEILENEVGPIKYLAALIYGESDRDLLEETVRLFILILVAVFDPLAVALLLAANYTLIRYGVELESDGPKEPKEEPPKEEPPKEEPPKEEPSSQPAPPKNNSTVGKRS
jgi:chaperonin cofactor prefoldin